MFDGTDDTTRRSVLKTVGSTLAAVGVAGSASADASTDDFSRGQCVYADGSNGYATVYAQCDSFDAVGRVENKKFGTVDSVCTLPDGTEWAYVVWDGASPDGWVREDDLLACVVPY